MQVAGHWRVQKQRYMLVGEVCENCGHKMFPPRGVCPACQTPAQVPEQASYAVPLMAMKEGPLATARLGGAEGDQVEVELLAEMVARRLR